MSFNYTQEKHDILINHDVTWILNGRVHFVKLPAGNYIQATRVEHGAGPPVMMAAMMRPGLQRSISSNDLPVSLAHTICSNARETAKLMEIKVTGTRGYCDDCGKAKVIRGPVPRETKIKLGRPLQRVFTDPTGPYPPFHAPLVGEVPTWGGGEVVDTGAAAVAAVSAVATVTGSGVVPASSARGAAGAPASAAVAAATAAATATGFHRIRRGRRRQREAVCSPRLRWTGKLRVMINPPRRPRHNGDGTR